MRKDVVFNLPDGLVQVCLRELEILGELQAGENELFHLLVHPVHQHTSDGDLYKITVLRTPKPDAN